jgi:hypothetical protein
MKKILFKRMKIFFILVLCCVSTFSQQSYYDVNAGNGKGIRFWSSDLYKISMGNTTEYKFGPVTDYSIKTNMNNIAGRGWTWGIFGLSPVAAISVDGSMQLAKGLKLGSIIIDNKQDFDWLYGLYLKVDRDLTKAFAIIDKNNNEVFRAYGNGIVYSKKVIAEAFEVRPDALNIYWYDNVFSSNYYLKPLSEVDQFIKENRHLPELPSEGHVRENGYNIVEMDGVLLKKIEELTLYIIQQQKEIEQLKKQLKK